MTDQTSPFLAPTAVPNRRDLLDAVGEPDPPEHAEISISLEPDENAPYGYTIDRKTGDRRPKQRAGRPRAEGTDPPDKPKDKPSTRPPDNRPPNKPTRDLIPGHIKQSSNRRRARPAKEQAEPPELGPFRAGPIAKGMNGLYLKAGRILRVIDHDIGTAVISMTRKETEDDVTVGEAWEELAKVNPRIRAALMRMITGGAWTQLLMAHTPLLMAIIMKERIRNRLPLASLIGAFFADEDAVIDAAEQVSGYTPTGFDAGMFTGLTQADIDQAMAFASQVMPGMAGPPRVPTVDDFGAESQD